MDLTVRQFYSICIGAVFFAFGIYQMICACVPSLRPKGKDAIITVQYPGGWGSAEGSPFTFFYFGLAFAVMGLLSLMTAANWPENRDPWLTVIAMVAVFAAIAEAMIDVMQARRASRKKAGAAAKTEDRQG